MASAAIQVTGSGITGPITYTGKYLNFDGKSGLTFSELTFDQCGQVRGADAHHITFYRCVFSRLAAAAFIQVELGMGNDYWIFDDCIFTDLPAQNAIYGRNKQGATLPGANFLTVKNCTFEGIGIGATKDGHCVGFQNGIGLSVQNNKVRNSGGTAFCAWADMHLPLQWLDFYNNDIDGVKKNPGASGSGIEVSSTYNVAQGLPKIGDRQGISLVGNKIANVEGNGFRYACARDPLVRNQGNTYANCAAGDSYINNPFPA